MKTLIFVRHAESLANAGGVTMPNAEIPLSTRGHEQAQQLAGTLDTVPFQVLVSSFLRTLETARPFCKRFSVVPSVHPLLHEFCTIDPSLIEGMDLAQRRPITEGYWHDADPDKRMGDNAETYREFSSRVVGFQSEMNALPNATVIFGHGMWLAFLVWRLLGFGQNCDSTDMQAFRGFQLALPMPNCTVFVLEQTRSGAWAARAAH